MKKNEFKSTPAVLRSAAFIDANKRLNDDLAELSKNPNYKDTEAYQSLVQQRDNYAKYGHIDGPQGLARDGGPKLFTYSRPQDLINVEEEALKLGHATTLIFGVSPNDLYNKSAGT